MKKTLILATAVIMLLCSFDLKNLFGSKAASTASAPAPATVAATATDSNADGKAAGAALKALYTQYKADGKYDYSNLNNILNTISLLDNCKQLKSNAKDGEYWKSFASGLILGSENLVTEDIANGVTEQLNTIMENVDTTKIQKAKENAVVAAGTVATCATGVSNLLSLFKK